jgi:hypothetical protein
MEATTTKGVSRKNAPELMFLGAGISQPASLPVDHSTAPQSCSLHELLEPSPSWVPAQQLEFFLNVYRGLFPDFFPENCQLTFDTQKKIPPDMPTFELERSFSRKRRIAATLRTFELSSSVWEGDDFICLLHGHLSCLVA